MMIHLLQRNRALLLALCLSLLAPACARGTEPGPQGAAATPTTASAHSGDEAWIAKSNEHTAYVLDVLARLTPELASSLGVDGHDDAVADLAPGYLERRHAAYHEVLGGLRQRLAAEEEPLVRQDLEILIDAMTRNLRAHALEHTHELPYFDVPRMVFQGLRVLLDDQSPPERHQAALGRLRAYAGMEPGVTPMAELAMARTRERLEVPGLVGPVAEQVTRDLDNVSFFLAGLGQLFERYQIAGYQEPLVRLQAQLAEYEAFVRAELLPRARDDFRLPPALYALRLETTGIDLAPAELAAAGRVGFREIQAEMQELAAQVARQRGWPDEDYRAVLRRLKQEQLVGESILPHYQERIARIEDIIREQRLVSLPERPVRVRLATPAESAQQPAPHMRPPRLVNNTGEQGEFVLPMGIPASDPSQSKQYDDFTYAAASWTLSAHEARPGHDLQFAAMVERGVSLARAIFAFNSVNVEGWALYAEHLVKPHMPLEGQLASLQMRLLRAARAFCDPELQLGTLTPAEVKAILMDEVLLSDAMATQEVERYTFRAPGQAGSYFHGYTQLLALRAEVEARLGQGFDQQAFHDFILAQGMLSPPRLRQAVMERFVGSGR